MPNIGRVVETLERKICSHHPDLKYIRYPKVLLSSLKELRDMVGNEKVKDAVASQVLYLTMTKKRIAEGAVISEDDVMLNTVLTGPPGVGKTKIGTILAKIWYSLGFLGKQEETSSPSKKETARGAEMRGVSSGSSTEESYVVMLYVIMVVVVIVSTLMSTLWNTYRMVGMKWLLVGVSVLLVIALAVVLAYYGGKSTGKTISEEDEKALREGRVLADDSIIRIVSRSDLVEMYVGWTAKKTKKVLEESVGKVLFIDEAYSLINGPHDEFGAECLSTIALFLSQRPRSLILVLGGYRDLLEAGVFAVQPGLKRRMMWQFDCVGYSPEELCAIFSIQLQKKGWDLEDKDKVKQLFQENAEIFTGYGGDTERLTFYSKLEHTEDSFLDRPVAGKEQEANIASKDALISTCQVERGMRKLRENNMDLRKKCKSSNPMSKVMDMFRDLPMAT